MTQPGADEHFAAFVREHTESLLRTGYLLTRDTSEAEELVQDNLVWLYSRWAQVQAAEFPLAYVRKALVNRFLAGRRRMSATEISFGDDTDPRYERSVADQTDAVDVRDLMWRELDVLPQRQRAAIVLRFFHDMPDDEVADMLECRPGTVRSLISRGLTVLRATGTFADDGVGSTYLRNVQ